MDEDLGPEISAALAKLAEDDAAAADDADSALRWLTGEEGVTALTQEQVQNFCWYELPMKWMTSLDDQLHVAASLGRALDLLGLPRYAAICQSETTRTVIETYETSSERGKAACRRAFAASGVEPPDLPDLIWGPVRGVQEMWAWSSVADFLEVAVASGELVPGARGWKTRQQELVRAHLSTPQPDLLGQTFTDAILTERAETWVNIRHSETRRQLVAALANRLLHPAQLPAGTTDPLPRVRALVEALEDGIALTARGNLNRKFVQQMADLFNWDFHRPPQSEVDFYDLHQVRELLQRLGLTRRTGSVLTLTARGRQVSADHEKLWRVVSAGLLPERLGDFSLYVGELFLVLLLAADSVGYREITATVHRAVAEEGFRDNRTDTAPDEEDVSWVVHDTINPCRALGLLAQGGDWRDRRYGLTAIGKATALEALHSRATGPRTVPWRP